MSDIPTYRPAGASDSRFSLVVFEQNTPAVSLYQRLGYEVIARAPVVPHPLIRCSGDAMLMVAPAF